VGSGSCGVINLTGQNKISPDSVDGSQVAFISGAGGLISITLAEVFENRQYTFAYSVGRRNDIAYPTPGTPGIALCGQNGFAYLPIPASGTWVNESLIFTPDPSEVGTPILITFQASGVSNATRILIDNVELTKL